MSWRKAIVAGVALALAAACGSVAGSGGEAPVVQVAGVVETRPAPAASPAAVTRNETPFVAPSSTAAPITDAPITTAAQVSSTTTAPAPLATEAERSLRERTIALIDYPWETRLPGWRIEFGGSRSGLRGLTRPDPKVIEIYVRPTDSPASLARVLAHEIGHAVDLELNSDPERDRWREVRGLPAGVRWWPDSATSDFDTGAGDFAEAFAVWLTGVASLSRIGAPLNADHLALVAQLAG